MSTARELLENAPEGQVARSRLIYKAIAKGDWDSVILSLENAIREEGESSWSRCASQLLTQIKGE